MIAPGMIRKMSKAYSDKRMTKDCRIHYQAGAWSNGLVAFREPLPKYIDLERDDAVEHDFWTEMEETHVHATRQVWPVEIRTVASGDESKYAAGSYLSDSGKRFVRLSNGNGLAVWLDAGYLSAILKREPTATLHVAHRKGAAIVARNGKPFAMVMPMVEGVKSIYADSPWGIVNDDLDAARNFDTANELAALLPARPGSKWHEVFYMGMVLEIRRSGRNNKERVLHVRITGRDATAHISLYDGRGVR